MSSRVASFVGELEFAIMCGELRPKQRLVEAELAAQYDVGRGIVREGLRILEDRGLVCHHSNKGGAVIDHSAEEICQIYLLRLQLEGMALALAVSRIAPAHLRTMSSLNDALRNGKLSHRETIQTHEAFHDVLFLTAGNTHLREFLLRLISRSGRVRYLQYVRAKSREKTLLQHEEFLAVLEKRDCAALLALNHRHLHSSLENYLYDFHPTEAESLLAGLQENLAALRLPATGAL